MKLVESSIIAKAENTFFQSFSSMFEAENLPQMFESKDFKAFFGNHIKLDLSEKNLFYGGEIAIFKDHVGFRFGFDVQGTFAILIDRTGNFIDFEDPADVDGTVEAAFDSGRTLLDTHLIKNREAQVVKSIADAINKQEVAELLEQKSLLKVKDRINYKEGKFTTSNRNLAYKLVFSIEIGMTLLVDEMGRFLALEKRQSSDNEQDSIREPEDIKILEQNPYTIGGDGSS